MQILDDKNRSMVLLSDSTTETDTEMEIDVGRMPTSPLDLYIWPREQTV